jgi:hypothetical protein
MISRSTLLRLLTEACELEHGLACSYLYSAMTLKQQPDGDRVPAEQAPLLRQWAAQVYFVASQEMLHLAQTWNLLTALGGTPYYLRPNFPQNTRYYPLHMRLALEPYGERALERFIAYEKPAELLREHAFVEKMAKPRAADGDQFQTIGELYDMIERGIADLPGAIIGDPESQVGRDLVDFPDIVKVVDVDSARQAIHLVTHQGEGNQTDRADCHFGIFLALQSSLAQAKKSNPKFEPAYPAILNPATDTSVEYGAPHANQILNPYTKEVAKSFDGLYSLMLRMLGYTFTPSGDMDSRRAFGQSAIIMMATVLKPLGEALAQLPAADDGQAATAGPPFGLTRHVMLPGDANAARLLVSERLAELSAKISDLASSPEAIPAIGRVEATLKRLEGINRQWFAAAHS